MRMLPILLVLIGCPEPVDDLPASAPGAGVPGAPGEVPPPPGGPAAPGAPVGAPGEGAPPVDGSAPAIGGVPGVPADGSVPPPPTDAPPSALGGDVPAPGMAPGPSIEELSKRTLASLAAGGATVKIRGRLQGATTAQVDFTAVTEQDGRKVPELLQIVQVTDGTFEVEAPSVYARDIYVSASADTKGDGIGPDDPGGIATKPVRLAGADVDVVITIATDGAWTKTVPWYVEGPPPTPPAPPAVPTGAAAGPLPSATTGTAPASTSSPSGWVFVK